MANKLFYIVLQLCLAISIATEAPTYNYNGLVYHGTRSAFKPYRRHFVPERMGNKRMPIVVKSHLQKCEAPSISGF